MMGSKNYAVVRRIENYNPDYSKLCPYCKFPACIYRNGHGVVNMVCTHQGTIISVRIKLIKNCGRRKRIDKSLKKLEGRV